MLNDSNGLRRLIQKVNLIVSCFHVFVFLQLEGLFPLFSKIKWKLLQQNPTSLTAIYFCRYFLFNKEFCHVKGCQHYPSETPHQQRRRSRTLHKELIQRINPVN